MDSKPHSCDLRAGRLSESGSIYLITTVTQQRIPWFRDLQKARQVVTCLREAQQRGLAETLAYVLMPDHLHDILAFPKQGSMSQVIGAWKSYHSKYSGVSWQDNYFDQRLRNGAELEEIMAAGTIDLITLDLGLAGDDGLSVARSVRTSRPTSWTRRWTTRPLSRSTP